MSFSIGEKYSFSFVFIIFAAFLTSFLQTIDKLGYFWRSSPSIYVRKTSPCFCSVRRICEVIFTSELVTLILQTSSFYFFRSGAFLP
jgi:hypothetical protein